LRGTRCLWSWLRRRRGRWPCGSCWHGGRVRRRCQRR
jgi:hypothetical protein